MPPTNTSSVAAHLAPGVREFVGTRLGGRESHYSRMYRVETSVRNYEDWLAGTGLPIAVEKPEGTDIQSFDPIEGLSKRLTHKTYAVGFEVTEEAWEDDLYKSQGSILKEAAEGKADSLAERVELEAHRPFNTEGFDGTFAVLPNGTDAFFATSHAVIAGAQGIAQANRPAANADLNITSLQSALITIRRYRDDQGKRTPMVSNPQVLVVPPELEYVAEELLKSSARPDQANPGVTNTMGGKLTPHVNPYIDGADDWFIKSAKHFNIFLWRWRPRMDAFDDRRARVAVFVGYERFSYGPIHWLGWYGSPGE